MMTLEEAGAAKMSGKKNICQSCAHSKVCRFNDGELSEYCNQYLAITALRPVSREPLEKFKEYFDDLYGKGLEVYGWHMNGEAKSFDDFYEDACEYAGL